MLHQRRRIRFRTASVRNFLTNIQPGSSATTASTTPPSICGGLCGSFVDAASRSGVEIALVARHHDSVDVGNLQFTKISNADRTIYTISGYFREVNIYASDDKTVAMCRRTSSERTAAE